MVQGRVLRTKALRAPGTIGIGFCAVEPKGAAATRIDTRVTPQHPLSLQAETDLVRNTSSSFAFAHFSLEFGP